MKNYSEMSDFEVNLKVFSYGVVDYDDIIIHSGEKVMISNGANWRKFDPCNNPSDAWPIIIENGISIRKRYYGEWQAIREWGESHEYDDNNPLRAAMMVYLMMKEAGA